MKQTLPKWASQWALSVDLIRKVVRANPELQKLGELYGATKVYTEAEAVAIREAVERRVVRVGA